MRSSVVFIMLACCLGLHAQEVPKVELGVLGCEDGSHWYGFSFTAQAGCAYELQSSTDLQTWTTEESFMGWGESHPVLMKAMPQAPAAPSLPAGAIPTPRPRLPVVRLLMRPATGGGLVLSWLSLDDGTPRNWCFPNFTLSVGWQVVPGYIRRFTSHEFLISSPQLAQVPPAVNPALGVRDAAMLAEFETRFPAMQAEVAALLERMVAQPFAATMPAERKFYRLVVESEVDTDGDGTPDRLEFQQLFQRAAGNFSIGGPAPDPFDGDTDGNGLADGGERSSDGDGTSDSEDAAPEDERVDWRKLPPYRYALFPLPEGAVLEGDLKGTPLQTCDFGNVLYQHSNQLFTGGVLKTLPEPAEMNRSETGIYGHGLNMKAVALDDTGSAYAVGQILIQAGGEPRPVDCLISWTPAGEHPGWLREGDGCLRGIGSYESYGTAPDLFMPTRIGGAQQERMFLGFIDSLVPYTTAGSPETYYGYHSDDGALWTVSGVKGAGAVVKTSSARPPHPAHTVAPDGTPMGYTGDSDSFVGDHDFQSHVPRVVRLPSNELMAIKASGPPMIRKDGEWREAKSFKETVVDVSADTGFVFHKFDGKAWQNGRVMASNKWVPGAFLENNGLQVIDAAPAGPVIMDYRPIFDSTKKGLALPLCIKGVGNTTAPFEYTGNADGVDEISLQATGGGGYQEHLWVMAPIGENASTHVKFLSSSNPTNFLALECESAAFKKLDGSPADKLDAGTMELRVSGTGEATADKPLKLKLSGNVAALNSPVKIKTMKRRQLHVAVHPVALKQGDAPAIYPAMIPSNSAEDRNGFATKLTGYMNRVYGPQVNLYFDVTVLPAREVDFDTMEPKGEIEITSERLFTDEMKIACTDPLWPLEQADIDIWILGGTSLKSRGGSFLGMKIGGTIDDDDDNEQVPYAIIDGSGSVGGVIAHEIGHIFMGGGHPDVKDENYFARLEGVPQDTRLMSTGESLFTRNSRCKLIKTEWDKIDEWLVRWEKR